MFLFKKRKRRLGLSLRGGGARCLPYLGILQAFKENDVEVDILIGSSMGAVISTLHAFGYNIDEIKTMAQSINIRSLLTFESLRKRSIVNDDTILYQLGKIFGDKKIEDAHCKLFIQTTSLETRNSVVFNSGPLVPILAASMAFPVLVEPIKINDFYHIDGDISSGFAADVLRKNGAEVVIGIEPGGLPPQNYSGLMVKFRIPMDILYEQMLEKDRMINPLDYHISHVAPDYDFLAFYKIDEFIEKGYQSALEHMPAIKKLLN